MSQKLFFLIFFSFLTISYQLNCRNYYDETCGGHNSNYNLKCVKYTGDQKCSEYDRQYHTDDPGDLSGSLRGLLRTFICCCRGVAVGYDSAYRGHIHDPAYGSPSKEGDHKRYSHQKYQGISGAPVMADLAKPMGKHSLVSHGVYKSAGSDHVSHKARHYSRKSSKAKNDYASGAQNITHHMEGGQPLYSAQIGKIVDIFSPS